MESQDVSVNLINPFVAASYSVMSMMFGQAPERQPLSVMPQSVTSHQVNAVVGVTGSIKGHVILGMSLQTADRIASAMIGAPIKVFDHLASSAIAELTNMICGNALLQISENGAICDLTPPTVIRGSKVQISTLAIPAIVVPLKLDLGEVFVVVGLRQESASAATKQVA